MKTRLLFVAASAALLTACPEREATEDAEMKNGVEPIVAEPLDETNTNAVSEAVETPAEDAAAGE